MSALRVRTKSTSKKSLKEAGISNQDVFTSEDGSRDFPRTISTPNLHDADTVSLDPPPPLPESQFRHTRANSFAIGTPTDQTNTPPWARDENDVESQDGRAGREEHKKKWYSFGRSKSKTREAGASSASRTPRTPRTPHASTSVALPSPPPSRDASGNSSTLSIQPPPPGKAVFPSSLPPVPTAGSGATSTSTATKAPVTPRSASYTATSTTTAVDGTIISTTVTAMPPALPGSTLSPGPRPSNMTTRSGSATPTALPAVPSAPALALPVQTYDPAHPATDPNWTGRATGFAAVPDQPTEGELYAKKMADVSNVAVAYIAGEESAIIAEGGLKAGGAPTMADAYNAAGGADGVKKAVAWIDTNVIDEGTAIVTTAEAFIAPAKTVISGIEGALDNDEAFKNLENTVQTALEHSEVLMKALSGLSDIHPAIGAAIFVFKTVINLELKRRDNDRKLGMLRVQRNEMMEIVADLSKVKDKKSVASDQRIIKIFTTIGSDIKDCQNACEVYASKKLIVQVLKSESWNVKLAGFGTRFQTRKDELQQALVFHTALGVDEIGRKMDAMAESMKAMQESNNLLLLMQMMQSPRERNLMELVKKKGGAGDVMKDETLLREIMNSKEAKEPGFAGKGGKSRDEEDYKSLRKDLATDIDVALQRNQAFFDRKFEAQQKQLDKIGQSVVDQADRVIKTLTMTVADRIRDEEIKKMWKDMGWKSSVKTGRFVNALRDYYVDKFSEGGATANQNNDDKEFAQIFTASSQDQWALDYINFSRLQPINEAFDDDASGFVSIKEVNEFTDEKPPNWSLPHWVAFWSAGWHLSLLSYQHKIQQDLMPRLLRAAKHVLPTNRAAVDRYLASYFLRSMEWIVTSVNMSHDDENLLEKFQPYVDAEEERMDSLLQSFEYEIDAQNSLVLVTGPGRIEKFILPLIYLIMKNHCTLIEECSKKAVDDTTLYNASHTWEVFYDAAIERLSMLIAVYRQQHLQPEEEIKRHSWGMFDYLYDPEQFDKREWMLEGYGLSDLFRKDESEDVMDDELAFKADRADLDLGSYDDLNISTDAENNPFAKEDRRLLQGFWDGFYIDTWGENRMCTNIVLGAADGFSGVGSDMLGAFEIDGDLMVDEDFGALCIRFRKKYSDGVLWNFNGHVDDEFDYIRGRWGRMQDNKTFDQRGTFTLHKRNVVSSLRRRPSPKEFKANRGKALWSVARTAVLQHMWTWSFIMERRHERLRFIDLFSRHMIAAVWGYHVFSPELSPDEESELQNLENTLGSRDTRFYVSYAKRNVRRKVVVHNANCDCCGDPVLGSRVICVECSLDMGDNTVDICHQHVGEVCQYRDGKTHYPSHLMIKVRRYVHYRQKGPLLRRALEARERYLELWAAWNSPISADEKPENTDDATPESEEEQQRETLRCSCCLLVLERPCWYCIACNDDTFLCDRCEKEEGTCLRSPSASLPDIYVQSKVLPCSGQRHDFTHPFLRCVAPTDVGVVEEIEVAMVTVEDRISTLEAQFAEHKEAMNQRFDVVESLLRQILGMAPVPATIASA